jgi:hypothetical protein
MIVLYVWIFFAIHAPLIIYFHDHLTKGEPVQWKWLLPQLCFTLPVYVYIIRLLETL